MLRLHNEVAVYVCVSAQVTEVVKHMCREFGGATVTESKGYWIDDSGDLHIDNTTIVTSSTDRDTDALEMGALVEWMFANSTEQAISVKTSWQGLCIFDRSDFPILTTRTA